MLISSDAPFSARYVRIFSILAFLLSVVNTVLLSITAVYAVLGISILRIPFIVAAAINVVSTALILAFSLWRFSVLATALGGILPSFLIAIATGGLWSISVIEFQWLPTPIIVKDTRWMLTASIAIWILTLVSTVVFWTLVITLRYRTNRPRKMDFMDRGVDENDPAFPVTRPLSTHSAPEIKCSPVRTLSLHEGSQKEEILVLPAPQPPKSSRMFLFPRASPTPPEQPTRPAPQAPPRPGRLEPSPTFTQTKFNGTTTSPFLNLLNLPKSKTGPPSPPKTVYAVPITEQEVSNQAAFDEWDTSSVSIQQRIMYSIAAAEASPNPGAPPHTRPSSAASAASTITRTHRSSSMPTPPRTPTQPQRFRTGSLGSRSNNNSQQSLRVISPIPTSPSPTGSPNTLTNNLIKASTQLRHMGIPLCDSPERERGARVTSPLQLSTSVQDVESSDDLRTNSGSSCHSPRSPEEDAAWQAQWAATLERKVTPPMPGFEVGPRESMRRMKEEISLRDLRNQTQIPSRVSEVPSEDFGERPQDVLIAQYASSTSTTPTALTPTLLTPTIIPSLTVTPVQSPLTAAAATIESADTMLRINAMIEQMKKDDLVEGSECDAMTISTTISDEKEDSQDGKAEINASIPPV